MAQGVDEQVGSGQLPVIGAVLDALFVEPDGRLTGRELLDRLQEGLRLEARLHTWLAQVAAKVDAAEVAWQEHGTSTATWLADVGNLTRHEAGRLIAAGQGLAPETVEAREAVRLEREHRLAMRSRHLVFTHDHRGQVGFHGSLPVAEAESLIRIIDAYNAATKRGIDRLDPHAEYVTPAMRRADALLAMVNRHSQEALAPSHGGDRPRIVITLSYDKLLQQCVDAGLVGSGDRIEASAARLLLCDADLMPAVLGGPSQILDVGRAQRLVTPAIRAALELRDAGCVFPGCPTAPRGCEAHHLIPWWKGGVTALGNLALLCKHHHGIVEPSHDPTADRWKIQLRPDGIPEILPPQRVDPSRRPRLHARFHTRR